jgi:uncharacterized protein YvpB
MASLTNVLLNGNVYQELLNYQSGIGLAQVVNRNHINKADVYNFNFKSSGFNFYTNNLTGFIQIAEIKQKRAQGKPVWIFTSAESKQHLQNEGIEFDIVYSDINYGITRLSKEFLNPATRKQVCIKDYLMRVR